MKGIKKIIAGIGAALLAVSMAGCFSTSEESKKETSKDVIASKENNTEVIKDGIFVEDTLYNVIIYTHFPHVRYVF